MMFGVVFIPKIMFLPNVLCLLIWFCWSSDPTDSRLHLTPFIESNQLTEAIRLSEVKNLPNSPSFKSYSGYLTVDSKYNSNLFFWFFPSRKNVSTAPLVIYLEGGPGNAAMLSIFVYGPLHVDQDLRLTIRSDSLIDEFSVLHIDSPVGTGYSYTEDVRGMSRNDNEVADNLYAFLRQFFTIFSEYKDRDLYVMGVSYGGKYVPALGYKLMLLESESGLNFKGMVIANGWTDPINQINHAGLLKSLGLIDLKQYESLVVMENETRKQILFGNVVKARQLFLQLHFDAVKQMTGYEQNNHAMVSQTLDKFFDIDNIDKYLAIEATRRAIHVDDNPAVFSSDSVRQYLIDDFFGSMEPNLTELMDKYKVLLITGNLDLLLGVDSINGMLENKAWKYSKDYYSADRVTYKVSDRDEEIAGYVKSFGNFSHVIVRNAGHYPSKEQPRVVLDVLRRFVNSHPFRN